MQDPPPESNANGEEVSLQNILAAIHNQSQQTFAAIQLINEGMERLSEKVDYMHQEQIDMESSQDAIRRDMEKLKTGKSLYEDITREQEVSSGEARERDVMTQLLEMLKGQKREEAMKRRYPIPLKNGSYMLNLGDERQMQKIFDQVKSKITKIDANFDMIEKLMIEIFKTLRVEEVMNGDEGEPITTMQLDEMLGVDDDSEEYHEKCGDVYTEGVEVYCQE